jgi:hypothetical protein
MSSNKKTHTSKGDGADEENGIAQQLCKNYFLNSKQLLKHLSPARNNSKLQNPS